ncbi:MAG: hypothetical protein A2020_05505 [Lentisphaerae bacterium GWF2_45_14]|nr:MAG: hypothetical protein A2020_05505 [Lentisphaerae bacterium GWF2_45_14]
MKITEEIKAAISKYAEKCGNVYQLSKKIGVSHSTILFWLDGRTENISGDVWHEKLYPLLRPYLHYRERSPAQDPVGGEEIAVYKSEVSSGVTLFEVPVLNFVQAAGYDPAFEPIDDYAYNCSSETALFDSEMKTGYFALKVEGDSMSPVLPDGTIVYVAGGEYAQNADLVVAKLRESGQVVIKKFARKENSICLNSINPDGKSFEFDPKQNPLVWMWPVIEYTVKARQQRWEKLRHRTFNANE